MSTSGRLLIAVAYVDWRDYEHGVHEVVAGFRIKCPGHAAPQLHSVPAMQKYLDTKWQCSMIRFQKLRIKLITWLSVGLLTLRTAPVRGGSIRDEATEPWRECQTRACTHLKPTSSEGRLRSIAESAKPIKGMHCSPRDRRARTMTFLVTRRYKSGALVYPSDTLGKACGRQRRQRRQERRELGALACWALPPCLPCLEAQQQSLSLSAMRRRLASRESALLSLLLLPPRTSQRAPCALLLLLPPSHGASLPLMPLLLPSQRAPRC